MRDSGHDDGAFRIVDRVDHPVLADANPVVVAPCQVHAAHRSGFYAEPIDGGTSTIADRALELAELARRRRCDDDLVLRSRAPRYSRTSAQGIAASRSSRACNAARLSSR